MHFNFFRLETWICHREVFLQVEVLDAGMRVVWTSEPVLFCISFERRIEIQVHLGSCEVAHALQVVAGVLLSHHSTFPPRCFGGFWHVTTTAFQLLFVIDLHEELVDLILFLQKMFLELCQVTHPLWFDCIVVTSKPPYNLFTLLLGHKLHILYQCFTNVLSFHQIALVKYQFECAWSCLVGFDSFDIQNLERMFR